MCVCDFVDHLFSVDTQTLRRDSVRLVKEMFLGRWVRWPSFEISYLIIFVPQSLQLLLTPQVPEVEPNPISVNLAKVQSNLHKGKILNKMGVSTHCGCNLLQVCPLMVGHQFHLRCLQEGCFPWDMKDVRWSKLEAKQTCIVQAKYEDKIFIFLCEVPIQATQQSIHDGRFWKTFVSLHQGTTSKWCVEKL